MNKNLLITKKLNKNMKKILKKPKQNLKKKFKNTNKIVKIRFKNINKKLHNKLLRRRQNHKLKFKKSKIKFWQ